ncbi:MAG: hypothetical protein ACREB2_01585 [Pseudolabrys sp.]
MRKLLTITALTLALATGSSAFAQAASSDYRATPNRSYTRRAPAVHSRYMSRGDVGGAYAYEPAPEFRPSSGPSGARCTLSPSNVNFVPCTGGL